jgi:hypothetical protein
MAWYCRERDNDPLSEDNAVIHYQQSGHILEDPEHGGLTIYSTDEDAVRVGPWPGDSAKWFETHDPANVNAVADWRDVEVQARRYQPQRA